MTDYTLEDFFEHTHVFTSFGFPREGMEYRGSQAVKTGLLEELEKFKFENLIWEVKSRSVEDVEAFVKSIAFKKVYITVHQVAKPFCFDGVPGASRIKMKPALRIADYIDQGKPAEHHIQILGGVNKGKTILANMVQKVLKGISPTTEVIIVDTDPYSWNFYYGDDAEREQFLSNIRHQKINVGTPMLTGV